MKKYIKKSICLLLAAVLALSVAGCSQNTQSGQKEQTQEGGTAQTSGNEKIVNVGVTDTLGSINPLLLDGGEINKHSLSLLFLPLVELDADLNFQMMLADSITTEDNTNFIVHIDENATWSDGEPITSEDVIYTALRLTSPVIGNAAMMYYAFVGVGDDGFVEEGAESIEGIQAIDEKTVKFTTKYPMSLITFQNSYGRYLLTLPKHKIEQYSESELATADWFNKPDVVSGPFFLTEYDADHYISYEANQNYWKGAPKIDKLNIRIVDGSQLYAGLQTGEIDITQHTMSVIPQEDYASVETLENVEVVYGSPVTNQSIFIQTANVPDVRVRQALVYAIDREQILNQLLNGHGEIVDGFLSSASPFYDDSITALPYDPEKAKSLVEEAGWDSSKTLRFYVNSGDSTFINAASVMVAQWAEAGIKVEIQTVDFSTLMTVAGTRDYDMLAVQYTYPPIDPYADIDWILSGEGSWTGYGDSAISEALSKTQLTSDTAEIKELYSIVNQKVQEDVPMISAYIISAQGAVNKRLTGAKPSVYGFFNQVQNWDVTE